MSIPPLVCSTPPPPEQCEDDKDQEDFDLNYQMSQEEDEGNDYEYGNYANFNHFKPPTSKTDIEFNVATVEEKEVQCDTSTVHAEINNTSKENSSGETLEDDVLEDLNLKIDHEPVVNVQKNNDVESDTNISEEIIPTKHPQPDIPVDSSDSTSDQNSFDIRRGETKMVEEDNSQETHSINEKPQATLDDIMSEKSDDNTDSRNCDINIVDATEYSKYNTNVSQTLEDEKQNNLDANTVEKAMENNDYDEFEDFDDFQFVSSDDKQPETILSIVSDNPWDNDVSRNDGFGNFTANFGDDDNIDTSNKTSIEVDQQPHDSEDDFGDFDEFQSVNNTKLNEVYSEPCDEVPVLNLQSSDSEYQIIERINKVMHTIFQEEISESNEIFESNLETSLGETWGYLRETDVRQPYIVNWNNSLAQKTLLRALCIDSRNILFGPKWSSNMPKYAANLSNAPLKPQKQIGQSHAVQNEIVPAEKAVNKTWTDPFTADGQEFTYAEALLLDLEHLMATLDQMAHNHSTLKISELLTHACHTESENSCNETGPTDLDVFEATMSKTPDKIYSNTLSIQPMRQINLPDTHIFTPTNSEIPRSKTIHYDNTNAPTVLVPQSVPDNKSSQTLRSDNDNDYWEFQDFRGVSDNKIDSTISVDPKDHNNENIVNKDITHNSKLTVATQVLQPIKLEPIMPTLNWPDPGEVKETFDDFSDFISNSQISNENQESVAQSNVSAHVPNVSEKDDAKKDSEIISNIEKLDDFEVFQSALPTFKNSITDSETNVQASSSQVEVPTKASDFNTLFSKVDKEKSENISLQQNVLNHLETATNMFKPEPLPTTTVQMTNTNILQPTIATPTLTKPSQPKMGQILQPLSLESYSQINWPNPGIDLQDLSRFNPVESLQSLKTDSNSHSKTSSPVHNHKGFANNNQTSDEDIWGEFVSSKPKQQVGPKKQTTFADDEEWTDFVSSPSVNPQNGLNTISFNVHTNSSMQKSSNSTKYPLKTNEISLDIPTLNYITPKSSKSYNERHFQNL